MANKVNTTFKSKAGKEYDRFRFTKTMEVYDKKTGEFVIKKKQFVGKNQKDANSKYDAYQEYIKDLKAEMNKSSSEKLAARMFGESVMAYIENTFLPDSTIKDATKLRYVNSYKNIFDKQSIMYKPVKDVLGEDIQAVLTNSDKAPSSKEAALKLLRNYYKYASSQHITHDVTQGIIIPKAKKKRQDQNIDVYTHDELNALLEYTPKNHRLRFLIILAMETGCRIGELCALTYSDIDLKHEYITINKSLAELGSLNLDGYKREKMNQITTTKSIDSNRTMPVTPLIKKELALHKKWHEAEMQSNNYENEDGYIFTSKSGELYFPSNLRMALKRLCDKINKDYNKANKAKAEDEDNYKDVILVECKGWHAFRHTYGSDLAAAGVPIHEVCKLMGHSDISVTSKYYVNVTSDQKRQAAHKLEEYRRSKLVG